MTIDTTDTVLVPGSRDVRASLDSPDGGSDRVVVACPPHPQFGGNRSDSRLTIVAESLAAEGIATLRFDYGDWDEGYGEREDARNAVRWAHEEYEQVGIFGYSFGGAIAVLAAAGDPDGTPGPGVDAVSSLAPAANIDEELDAAAALERLDCPYQVIYGSRDTTADWKPLVDRARELGYRVEEFSADHHFVGQKTKIAGLVCDFFVDVIG